MWPQSKKEKKMKRKILIGILVGLAALVAGVPGAGAVPRSFPYGVLGSEQGKAAAPLSPTVTGFTYQGQLNDGANPANGQYDFTFKLFDSSAGGVQVGSTITKTNQTVSNGLFTVTLDFGTTPYPGPFTGEARWLEIAVRSTGGGGFTTLSPRQALTAAPYALSLRPGAIISH